MGRSKQANKDVPGSGPALLYLFPLVLITRHIMLQSHVDSEEGLVLINVPNIHRT